jgi:methionine synthase I (cobalamin-dependent)
MLVGMSSTNDTGYDTDVLETLSQRVVVGDGAMGTQLQAADLSLDDFNNRLALKGTAIAKRVRSSWASRRRVTT